jgi:hypothetical protein
MLKSRRMRLVGGVACTGEIKDAYTIFVGRHRKEECVRCIGHNRDRYFANIKF